MTESEFPGWFYGEPEKRGRYLIVDAAYWTDRLADFIPGEKGRPGRWYIDSRPSGEASAVAYFRPVPRIPPRPTNGDVS